MPIKFYKRVYNNKEVIFDILTFYPIDNLDMDLGVYGKRFFVMTADFDKDYIRGLESSNVNRFMDYFQDLGYWMTMHEDESYGEDLYYLIDIEDLDVTRFEDIDSCESYMSSFVNSDTIHYTNCSVKHILKYFRVYEEEASV